MERYTIKVCYTIECYYDVLAENHDQARQIIEKDCGFCTGSGAQTSNEVHVKNWKHPVHAEGDIVYIRNTTRIKAIPEQLNK